MLYLAVFKPECGIFHEKSCFLNWRKLNVFSYSGVRTLILILDRDTKDLLAPKYYKTMWPYRRNKTLNIAYMFIEKGQKWFMDILNQATDTSANDKNVNPKNCVGTVLALNGHRRFVKNLKYR